ncbi:tescalcin a isoform X1 [Callorhinchus milii]|uniref:tescalcin a isoform X1 n=1 Tax=Callorhinchus milii TaxID=7868 RepID=UPI001C3FAFA4|nr:tescalcin a isoform X1 [Callorhinchus milii]XP_042193261.1 tescalcin a isoform X1 [Callorhinchus milii]
MGSAHSLPDIEIKRLMDKTDFTSEQIEILHKRFMHLSDGKPTMRHWFNFYIHSKNSFESVPDLENNPIKTRIIKAFFDSRNLGLRSGETVEEITFENFLSILSFFQHMDENHGKEELDDCNRKKLRFLFNMYDTDQDGKISLRELKQVIDELLCKKTTTENTSSSIADAAMIEAANICVGQMTPDQIYEGITFEDFLKIMKDMKIESKMHVRFLNMDTSTMCK